MSNGLKNFGSFINRSSAQALVLAALGALAILLQVRQPYTRGFLGFDLGLAILSVCLPYATRSASQAFDRLPGLIAAISKNDAPGAEWTYPAKKINRGALWASGLVLAVFGLVTGAAFGVPWTGAALAASTCWLLLVLFGYGALACLYAFHMRFLWRLRRVEVKCQVFEWPREEIQGLYRIYSGLLAWGASLYVIAIASVWSSPGVWLVDRLKAGGLQGRHFNDMGSGSSWLAIESAWVFPAGAMVIFFFLLFHLRCHMLLVQCREHSLRELGRLASLELEAWNSENRPERLETIDRFLAWREKVHGERVWPIDLRAAVATFTTVLAPTIKTLTELSR